jgi:hypothetical protein
MTIHIDEIVVVENITPTCVDNNIWFSLAAGWKDGVMELPTAYGG